MESLRAADKWSGRALPGASHEVIVLDMGPGCTLGLSHDVAAAVAPVVHHVVDILVEALHLRVAGLVFNIEVAIDCHAAVGLKETAA